MTTTRFPAPRTRPAGRGLELGFTLSEAIVVVFLVAILTAIVVGSVRHQIERARMANCMVELRGIQAAAWHDVDGGSGMIDPDAFWETHYRGTKPGPYVLLVNGGEPGRKSGDSPFFVAVGRHDDWAPGTYVFIEDDKPPQIVTGPDGDPGYGGQVDWESGEAWSATSASGDPGFSDVGWAGTQSTGNVSMSGTTGAGSSTHRGATGRGSNSSSSNTNRSGRSSSSRIGE